MEIGPIGTSNFTYIDMKTYGKNTDYDARIGVTDGITATSGKGVLNIECGSCLINSNTKITGTLETTSNTKITGTLETTGQISSSSTLNINGMTNNSTHNNSWYYSFKGNTYNDATLGQVYTYTKYDGTSGSSTSESIGINLTKCKCFKIQYSYDTRNLGATTYQAYTEWVFIKNVADFTNTWTKYVAVQVGNYSSYVPTITTTSTSMTINFPYNSTSTAEFIHWNFAIYMM